jgi:hypothetical protein
MVLDRVVMPYHLSGRLGNYPDAGPASSTPTRLTTIAAAVAV